MSSSISNTHKFQGFLGNIEINFAILDPTGFYSYELSLKDKLHFNTNISQIPIKSQRLKNKPSSIANHNKLTEFLKITNSRHSSVSCDTLMTSNGLIQQESLISFPYIEKLKTISQGYFTYLRIHGVGYRVYLTKRTLTFKLGFSHQVKVEVPNSIQVFLPEPTLIYLYGIDKNEVTQTAAIIQSIKKPSPYKGKGIRLLNSEILLKTAKKK